MEVPKDLLYTKEHEWLRVNGSKGVVGITHFAQDQLGDVVFVELPKEGADLNGNATFGVVESVKAVSDLYAPVSGTVTEANQHLNDEPELVNSDPFEDGWMLRIEMSDASEMDGLQEGRVGAQLWQPGGPMSSRGVIGGVGIEEVEPQEESLLAVVVEPGESRVYRCVAASLERTGEPDTAHPVSPVLQRPTEYSPSVRPSRWVTIS